MKSLAIGIILVLIFPALAFNQEIIKMPGFFNDNMVLQRDKPIKFWGTSSPQSTFTIEFAHKIKSVIANADGKWQVIFPPQKAGGPYELSVKGINSFSFKNIVIGDVWIASGQSNMEFRLGNTDSVALDMTENNNLRYLSIPSAISNYPQTDVNAGEWRICNKTNAPSFSAVAYYFAQKMNKETGVPIGIINASWGGTSIKAWMSEEGIAAIPEYKLLLDTLKSKRYTAYAIDSIAVRNNSIAAANNIKIMAADKGYRQQWTNGNKGDAVWNPIQLPGTWQTGDLKDFDGVLWFRKEIDLPASVKDELFYFHYGINMGLNELYINGVKAGTGYYFRSDNRFYLKPNILLPGKNIIVIRLFEKEPNAGFKIKADEMLIQSVSNSSLRFPLSGLWEFSTTLTNDTFNKLSAPLEVNAPITTVSSIYNVKINPLIPLSIKGILWYQGESDVAVSYFYRRLFLQLIKDWRTKFQDEKLPFIFAQLPAFGKVTNELVEQTEWPQMRASQAEALKLPHTAMAVTLDVGNPLDIHPHHKKPVGERMAEAALFLLYRNEKYVLCPVMQSYSVQSNEVHIKFKNVGSGLTSRNNEALHGFAIAGADMKFREASVRIIGKDEIAVNNTAVKQPLSVRYAWKASPLEANLINKEGKPAAPFRTDQWSLSTEGKFDNKN